MTIQNKLNAIKQVKATIKETLIDKGIEITENDTFSSFATKTNEVVTDTVLLNSLNAIKNVLIAKGIQATDDYSTYANLIEELDMGDKTYLINNGENGWYSINEETGYATILYEETVTNLSHYDSITGYVNMYYFHVTRTLPISFERAQILHWKLFGTTSTTMGNCIQDENMGTGNNCSYINGNTLELSFTLDSSPLNSGTIQAYIVGKLATS